ERRLHLVELAGDAEADRRAGGFELLVQPVAGGHGGRSWRGGWSIAARAPAATSGPPRGGGAIVAIAAGAARGRSITMARWREEAAWRQARTEDRHHGRRRGSCSGTTVRGCWGWRCWVTAWSPRCCCWRWRRWCWW